MIKKIFAVIAAISLFCPAVFAGAAAGTTVFNFLKLPATASQAALAGMASYDSASAPLNPSMAAFQDKPMASASYAAHFQGTSFNSANFTLPLKKFALNAAYGGLNYGDIENVLEDADGGYVKNGTFTADDAYAALSCGLKITEYISAGAGIKYVWQTIDGSKIEGIAFCAAATYVSDYGWYISSGMENAGPDVESYPLPSSAFVSFIDTYEPKDVIPGEFSFGGEVRAFFDNTYWLKASGEYNFKNIVFVRAGYALPLADSNGALGSWYETNFSFGIGFSYEFFKIDYAWLPFGDLGSTNMFSLQITF
ncbi:MAG: hypothetical protein FWC57_05795 [Endomicrobia bacterium]|nr:hypothetical protein [Endomicrobiia bacterium]